MSDSDIVQDFLAESYENLDRLDRELVELEKNPTDCDALAGVFRTIHTIKGTCGFLGFSKLEKVAHVGENLLARLRDGQLTLNPEITTALLSMVDAVRQMLQKIQATGQDGSADYPELRETLTRLQDSGAESGGKVFDLVSSCSAEHVKAPPVANVEVELGACLAEKVVVPAATQIASSAGPETSVGVAKKDPLARRKLGVRKNAGAGIGKKSAQREGGPPVLHEAETGGLSRDKAPIAALSPVQPSPAAASRVSDARARDAAPETIRVGVNLLDELMTLVGELVLARNQLLQLTSTREDASLHAICQRMNLIATELQEEVMKTRMQPIGNIWAQFPRTVRDVALGCGKQVNIEMEGKETELDKTIIEAIKDPLTHLVRNSVDHGIELPEVRVQAGKTPMGRLILRAFHEGGQVNIEISDDGAGLNLERIRQKAIERGVVSTEQAIHMSEAETFNLIFLPGFSTAAKVTNVSGRGVGMDVVKTNVEKIGGVVDVQSTPGHGTTVRVKIPLTLAITPALVVTCAGDRYAIPQVSLLELVRLEAEHTSNAIEMVHGVPVYRLRGRLLPLVYLSRELQLDQNMKIEPTAREEVNIVVLQADQRRFGLVVHQINDTEEIVVKPLRKQLRTVKTFAGSSIMGDGKVALILDVLGLAQRASVVGEGANVLSLKPSATQRKPVGKSKVSFSLPDWAIPEWLYHSIF